MNPRPPNLGDRYTSSPICQTKPQLALLFTNNLSPKSSEFWENFEVFLLNDYRGDWKNQVIRNVKRYGSHIESCDLSILKTFTDHKRLSVMKSFAAYAKFSGSYERFRHLIKQYGLKWSTNNDDVIIARLLKYGSNSSSGGIPREFLDWIKSVRVHVPDLDTFMDFVISTGLRLDEAINSYSLIVELSNKGQLDRCSVKYLKQPEIDFLQGRVSASVFMQNYFNPQFIADLQDRALQNSRELLTVTRKGKQNALPSTEQPSRQCQPLVTEVELPKLLAQGWRVVVCLPSGKIVVGNEH